MNITFDSVMNEYNLIELDVSNIKNIHPSANVKRMAICEDQEMILTEGGNLDYYAGLSYETKEMQYKNIVLYCDAYERIQMIQEWLNGEEE